MVYMRGVNKKLIIKNYDGLFPLPDGGESKKENERKNLGYD
jgi:hypothetical protein